MTRNSMFKLAFIAFAVAAVIGSMLPGTSGKATAGELPMGGYKVLPPISHGRLTIFPVVASSSHDTRDFITLDEGLRSGEVVVTEAGRIQPLIRRGGRPIPRGDGAEVNRLMLVNESSRPLLLLAGEIVTGGKQDRVVGKDRIVPAKSEPIDLAVFCVEPGRWVGTGDTFIGVSSQMAQPSVRSKAMAEKDQAKVWQEVQKSNTGMAGGIAGGVNSPAAHELAATSSYARAMANSEVAKQVDAVAAPIQQSYESLVRQLRERNAVGVVVAVGGQIIWADIFASNSLLEKYWPKLVRSYAAESITANRASIDMANVKTAQEFLERMQGRRESVESEPGVYRHTEISGDNFRAFELTSLLPHTGFDVHIAKMAE